MRIVEKSIIRTLAYAGIFNCGLKKEEIAFYFHQGNKHKKVLPIGNLEKELAGLLSRRLITRQGNYYYLPFQIIKERRSRLIFSRDKLERVKKMQVIFSFNPFLDAVFLSGTVAAGSAEKSDDIDLFIIASEGRLWLCRLFLIFSLVFMGSLRRRDSKDHADKLCPNMLLDFSSMKFSRKYRNFFTAHEIIQAVCIFDRHGTYKEFLRVNDWVLDFLPIAYNIRLEDGVWSDNILMTPDFIAVKKNMIMNTARRYLKASRKIFKQNYHNPKKNQGIIFRALEMLVYKAQMVYMGKGRRDETVNPFEARFHPHDLRMKILKRYQNSCKLSGVF